MLFNSFVFAVFLAIVLPLYYLLRWRCQNILLLVASYVFYGWWDWRFLSLLAISTLVDYVVGVSLSKTERPSSRKALLIVSMCVNLGLLGLFKYFNFFVGSAASLLVQFGFQPHVQALSLVLPVGISFYTFQTMAYTISVYRRQAEPTRNSSRLPCTFLTSRSWWLAPLSVPSACCRRSAARDV